MKKSKWWLWAALLLILPALPVWSRGSSAQEASGASGWPKVTFGFTPGNFTIPDDGTWPTEIFNALREKLQIDLEFMSWPDFQALDLALAAGDLPDVVEVQGTYMTPLLTGNFLQPMDDYLHLAPNLVSSSPLRIAASRKYYSNDGKLYFITPHIGGENAGKAIPHGLNIRWDYYKELGYPEVKNEDDFLNVVAAAVARHPTTPDGKKVYGVATFSDGGLWGWCIMAAIHGYMPNGYNYALGYSKTDPAIMDRLVNAFTDYDSGVWHSIEYYRKANKMGIFDPDSLIMTGDDLNQKASDGQIVSPNDVWYGGSLYAIQKERDPNSMAQYLVLPVEGQYFWTNQYTQIGWSFYYGINRKAKNVESIMKTFDYLSTPDGVRFAANGPQGGLWDIIDGKPRIKPEAIELQNRGGDEWTKRGSSIWGGLHFISADTSIASDGGLGNLWLNPEMYLSTLTPAEKDFSSHYGVTYPAEAMANLVKQGKAYDQSGFLMDFANLLPAAPQNVQRIDTACLDIMVKAIPRLVLATDDGEFESLKTQLQRDLQNAGIQTSIDWYMAAEKDIKDFLASVR
jgi:hypothetical protein